jgi:alpha-glucosidase
MNRSVSAPRDTMWHRDAVLYQIYPLSFQDTNGDGKGDLRGILARVDHLSWLGVDAVWLGPVQPSPMDDFGYDISNYEAVDPTFGTLGDLDRLTEELHRRGIRLLLDYVPNHTSSAHPWFVESRSSRDNPKHDWYIWVDAGPEGGPPTNWLSRFGGPAWEWEPRRDQYYCHIFLPTQPDLNWRNPDVRAALMDVLRFWLRRGIDGFRVDAAAVLSKDPSLRDDPPNPEANERTPPPQRLKPVSNDGRPECLEWLRLMREVVDEFDGKVLLGEVDTSPERVPSFYGTASHPLLHLPLNYSLLDQEWDARVLAEGIRAYLDAIPDHGWPVWGIGGQDKKRIVNHVGRRQARNAAMLALTLRGTPLIYAGDEMGMEQVPIDAPPLDPFERRVPGYGLTRDPQRRPMQWDPTPQAGFTTGEPWLPVAPHDRNNVEAQKADPRSLLHLYRTLIALRRETPALREGVLDDLRADGSVLTFCRSAGQRRLRIALNLGHEPVVFDAGEKTRLVLSTELHRDGVAVGPKLELRADEGVVLSSDER